MSIQIVTHWQKFHIDELFAIVFLKLYVDQDINITRTREPSQLTKFVNDPDVWVLDVGGEYNPDMKNFDHHQATFKKSWSDGTPMSTCGIVWTYLRENNYLSQHMNSETMDRIEKDIIIKVDKQDNGIEHWTEAFFIGLFNRQTDDQKKMHHQFMKALSATEDFYKNFFGYIRQNMKADKNVSKVIKKSEQYAHVVFMDSNNQQIINRLSEYTDKQIVVLPYKGKNTWKIQAITPNCHMPKAWRGLSGKQLSDVSGVPNMVFCHKTGFMCVIEADKDTAINVAKQVYAFNQLNKE
jgi:uncharacterized UPF0160 family protein